MRKAAFMLMYTTQMILIAMTYSVELFCMVCLGLSCGYAVFIVNAPNGAMTAAADPCCTADMDNIDCKQTATSASLYQSPHVILTSSSSSAHGQLLNSERDRDRSISDSLLGEYSSCCNKTA